MKLSWSRDRAGRYEAGPYRVQRNGPGSRRNAIWVASGPGIGRPLWPTAASAKDACRVAALVAKSSGLASVPAVGDRVFVAGGLVQKAGRITAVARDGYHVTLACGRQRFARPDQLKVVPA